MSRPHRLQQLREIDLWLQRLHKEHPALFEWHGFHAFRRGLGTRLYNNGTPIETVAKVLRHGSGSEVTLKHYVEIEEETKAAALQSLPRKIKKAK